jgi:WD40 repeat protein
MSLAQIICVWIAVVLCAGAEVALAQSVAPAGPKATDDDAFTRPKLVLNGAGHTSPLRVLAFTPDGAYLLSGGTDKVVHVWDLRGAKPRLSWSIRPPLNRRGGWVYSLAVARSPADQSYRVAVAGYGASLQAGDIRIYRLPPRRDPTSGDLVAHIPADNEEKAPRERAGHSGAVFGLDFSPDGRYLASCSQDQSIRIWDLVDEARPRALNVLSGHPGEVVRVAFLGNDQLLSAGGAGDGSVRVWNWRNRGRWAHWTRPDEGDLKLPQGVRVTALAISTDHRQVVIGRENGRLEAYAAPDLSGGRLLNPNDISEKRPIEALAFSPDGKTLAVSTLKDKPGYDPRILTRTDCTVTLRAMPEGGPATQLFESGDRIKALAFQPKDATRLAIGGGEAHAVIIKEAKPDGRLIASLPGPGTVLWNVGFVRPKPASAPGQPDLTVAFARKRPAEGQSWKWEAFDLTTGRFESVPDPSALSTAVHAFEGWTVKSVPGDRQDFLFTLLAVSPEGREIPLPLSPAEDLRWTCYTFIPPNPAAGHSKLMVAVASLSGSICFFSLPDGQKTRLFSGHAEAVYGLAPSVDGRWLATASADQTVRLWTLRACDTRPGLGATLEADPRGGMLARDVGLRSFAWEMGLRNDDRVVRCTRHLPIGLPTRDLEALRVSLVALEPDAKLMLQVVRNGERISMRSERREPLGAVLAVAPTGGLVVSEVPAGSPALEMGLRVGDRIVGAVKVRAIALPVAVPRAFDQAVRAVPPGVILEFATIRGGQEMILQTSRRDAPALSFFASENLEWIVWMPEGYYHSSVEGDRELLGWHVNRDRIVATTTTFYPMSRFAAQLRRPAVIRGLLATGDVPAVLARARVVPPPRIRLVVPEVRPGAEIELGASDLKLRIEASAGDEDRRVRSIVVRNGTVPFTPQIGAPVAKTEVEQVVPLLPDLNPISIMAIDDQGVKAIEYLRVRRKLARPVALAKPRLVIRSIGVESFAGRDYLPIRYAGEDARKLAAFLAEPAQRRFFEVQCIDAKPYTGTAVDATTVAGVFDELAQEARSKKLGAGDTLFVVLESHVISLPPARSVILAANAPDKPDSHSSVPARLVTECLQEVASRGCLVVLLLDAIHDLRRPTQQNFDDLNEWIRDLTLDPKGGVIVVLASKHIPGRPAGQLGAFARAILESMDVAGQGGPQLGGDSPTLEEFYNIVYNRVQELTERRQFTGFFTPETLQLTDRDRMRIFEPQPPRVEEVAGR